MKIKVIIIDILNLMPPILLVKEYLYHLKIMDRSISYCNEQPYYIVPIFVIINDLNHTFGPHQLANEKIYC